MWADNGKPKVGVNAKFLYDLSRAVVGPADDKSPGDVIKGIEDGFVRGFCTSVMIRHYYTDRIRKRNTEVKGQTHIVNISGFMEAL
jgi:hypothetical protein